MTSEEWNEVFDLFHTAREKAGMERVAVLDTFCGEDTQLREAVEVLLREDDAASGFLSAPLFCATTPRSGAPAIEAGQRVGRYVTVSRIGRGGMGEVWSAQDTDLDRPVALKFLTSETLADLDPQQMMREAKAASGLNHHGIVTIHEVVQSEAGTALVMELVEGKPLRDLCGKAVPVQQVLTIGLQIAEALSAAHIRGTIHGDIKPENIVLRPDRYVKLLDFGLARNVMAAKSGVDILAALGTLRYMSPEQARGEPLTPASDIFSFGLVLYELLTGSHAFPALVPLDTAQGILNKEAVPPSTLAAHIPARLEELIMAMLAKEHGERPSATLVQQTLKELLIPQRSGLAAPMWLWQAAAALLLVGVGYALWLYEEERGAVTFRQVTTFIPENRATAAAISPDGQSAVFANIDGIYLRDLRTGETRTLPSPGDFAVDRVAWFNDGAKLVVSGFSRSSSIPYIWGIFRSGEPPVLLRRNARWATPSPDGGQISFLSGDRSEIWTMQVNGGGPRKVLTADPGSVFNFAFWSPDAHRLLFERNLSRKGEINQQFESINPGSGAVDVESEDLAMRSPAMLPDGRLLFLKWDNTDFASAHELWEVQTDLVSGALVRKPRKIASLPGDNTTSMLGLSVSANGKKAMALVESVEKSVFVADFDPATRNILRSRRLTLDDHTNYPHAWTADSRSVIFESNRNGTFDLFKQSIDQRTPETLVASPMTEILPQLTPDGHSVLYAAHEEERGPLWFYHASTYKLMRVAVEGGTPHEVSIGGRLDEFRCSLGMGKRCVLRTTVKGKERVFYELDPIRGRGRELARISWSWELLGDWDISPDGTEVAIPNHSSQDARIRVVSLEPKPNRPREREVVLPGVTELRGVVWAADGQGWFITTDTTIGHQVLYATQDGRFQTIGDGQSLVIPSADGRHLAFLDSLAATNAWVIDRQ